MNSVIRYKTDFGIFFVPAKYKNVTSFTVTTNNALPVLSFHYTLLDENRKALVVNGEEIVIKVQIEFGLYLPKRGKYYRYFVGTHMESGLNQNNRNLKYLNYCDEKNSEQIDNIRDDILKRYVADVRILTKTFRNICYTFNNSMVKRLSSSFVYYMH